MRLKVLSAALGVTMEMALNEALERGLNELEAAIGVRMGALDQAAECDGDGGQ